MKKWEYKMKAFNCDLCSLLDYLDRIGDEGWELCGKIDIMNAYTLVFKREKKE